MKNKPLTVFAMAVGLLMVSAPMFAHHGAAAYEKKLTTLKGIVTDFRFINPHTSISFDVTDDNGKVENWVVEASSLVNLSRHGWNKNIIKPGDQITVTGNRAKNGSNTLRLSKIVLPNGKESVMERGDDYVD